MITNAVNQDVHAPRRKWKAVWLGVILAMAACATVAVGHRERLGRHTTNLSTSMKLADTKPVQDDRSKSVVEMSDRAAKGKKGENVEVGVDHEKPQDKLRVAQDGWDNFLVHTAVFTTENSWRWYLRMDAHGHVNAVNHFDAWEIWVVKRNLQAGTYALLNQRWDKYVRMKCAADSKDRWVRSQSFIGSEEQFKLVWKAHNSFWFTSVQGGLPCCLQLWGGGAHSLDNSQCNWPGTVITLDGRWP